MDNDLSLKHFHRVILLLGLMTLCIYAAAIVAATLFIKAEISDQILQRDGILLTSVTQHFHDRRGQNATETELVDIALESSEIRGVIGVRLYQEDGELLSLIPVSLYPSSLTKDDLDQLGKGTPVIRHFENLPLDSLFSDEGDLDHLGGYPTTEILTPVRDSKDETVAIIQYWLDGKEVASELRQLDHSLLALGGVFFLAGGLIFILVFLYARGRLLNMGLLLAERNASLEQANVNLALAARTSAIGSVTSHLFHGLKNPLAGLKAYLRLTGQDEEAIAIADRMQTLIDEALNVISEDNVTDISLTLDELRQLTEARLEGVKEGTVLLEVSGEGNIPARKAQLILLILRNLAENALEASPSSAEVMVRLRIEGSELQVEVEDRGPGLPENVKERLFEPVQSSKTNGTGIGLAISSVIARHIPASLNLAKSGPDGTIFSIRMPL